MAWRITPADYDGIRAAIDISLSEGSLPDEIIALPVYSGYAEQVVATAIPGIDVAPQEAQDHAHNAAMLYCAASLVYAIPMFTREQGPEFEAVIERVKPDVLAADLRARAQAEVAAAAPETALGLVPLTFTVAAGTEGGGSVPTASAGLTALIVERVIDTDPFSVSVSVSQQTALDGGTSVSTTVLPSFRGCVQRQRTPPVVVSMGPEAEIQRSNEYVLLCDKRANLGEVTPARVLVFTHPVYGKLRITDVHPYRIGGEVCGYACTLAQIR